MQREKRIKRRKARIMIFVLICIIFLTFLLHRQITVGVFSPLAKGAYYHIETEEQAVCLTFDLVWEPGETGRILDVLDRYKVHSTFFLSGAWVRKNPDLAREILVRGHEIGYHGYTHKNMTEFDDDALSKEFEWMEEAFREELNVAAELFRPPYGEVDSRLLDSLNSRGYTTVLWTIDPHDWLSPGVDKIVSRVVERVQKGSIILMHSSASQAVDALPVIIQSLKMKGYDIIPFGELREQEISE